MRDVLTFLTTERSHHLEQPLSDETDPVKAFIRAVIVQSATVAAKMDALGFVHGMLNSDNHVSGCGLFPRSVIMSIAYHPPLPPSSP